MKYWTLGILLLVGCPKTLTVTCVWTGNGNPTIPVCGSVPVPNCLLNYTLVNQATGEPIATIPITATSYSFSTATAGLSASNLPILGLRVNEQTASGVVSSPLALSSVTVQ